MSKSKLLNTYDNSPKIKQIVDSLQTPENKLFLEGLAGSSLSFVINALFTKTEKPFLVLLNDKEEAAYYLNDLEQLIGEKDVLFYPGSYRRPCAKAGPVELLAQ